MSQKQPDGTTEWEKAIQGEAMNFVTAVQQNFLYGLKLTRKLLPKMEPYYLLAQLNIFVDAMTAIHVQTVVNFVNPSEEVEESVIASMRDKFKIVRQQLAKAEEAKKLGLVDAKGAPLTAETAEVKLIVPPT